MRASTWVMAAALAAMASGAVAETRTVPTVLAGSAKWTLPNTVTLNATVQLNDGCWSNPRFVPPLGKLKAAPGQVAPIEIQADHETGKMCAQMIRNVPIGPYNWRIYPNPKLTGVKFIGSAHPVTATIGGRTHRVPSR